ncbi:flotillin-like protein FloA [Blastopirellula sp. JC732]|uniref:Flotillin-like protein FloA n=1 Tax=Blastopirellula sediminis TaxID=2894196 RepID=A0A9X1SG74_9BACT|nr:flotillin-like protein FloA [Blastopirellula sediminis]MCC9606813.1 flotillin-like protein FloA [Blastopirellula sediminis]MCC9629890.1 flotillin-like protein FloA [Blastopirellula sediminis]
MPNVAPWMMLAQESGGYLLYIVLGGLLALFGFVFLIILLAYGPLWFQAYMSQAGVSLFELIGMSFRQVNSRVIVKAKIMASQSGLSIDKRDGISTKRLEAHYLAGGNVMAVIHAIIAAHRAQIALDFDRAAAIDLAGRDVVEAVRTSVSPKVIDCPDPRRSGKATLSAIAKNGIELRVRAKVTVRTSLEQLIGGATEETVIARVGECIISAIGSSDTHTRVLENPDLITRAVLDRNLDAQTAYAIISIDIADIDVGENIGARLQNDQAEADTRVARAKAEQRRAEAVATEQENKAKVVLNRAKLVLAEAEVPKSMAQAFRNGSLHAQGNGELPGPNKPPV